MANRWDNVYRPVKPWTFYTQLAVPTIFGDSLSYLEDVSKMSYTLNEVISSLNGIPKFVDDAIQAAFDQSGIQEEIKTILAENVIDAKNPPEGLKPVVGDGVTNDTSNMQQILNFAGNKAVAEGVKKLVSLPAGVYSVDQLTIPDNVSLVGETVYTTIVKAQDYSNTTLLTANLSYSVIGNVTFDANSTKNQTYPTVLDLTVNKDSKMQNVRVVNCNTNQDAMLIDNQDILTIDNLYSEGKITTTGDNGAYDISNLCIKGAAIGLIVNSNYGNIASYLPINCPTAVMLNGDSNTIQISGVKGVSNYTDNGILNTIRFSGEVIKEWLESLDISANTSSLKLGDATVNANTYTEDIADDKHTIVKGDKTVSAGTLTVDVDGDLDVTAASSSEVVSNGKEVNVGDLTTRVVGEDSLTAGSMSRVASTVTASAQVFSGVLASAQVVTKKAAVSGDSLKTDFKETTLSGETVKIAATNPIVYREKQKLDDNFDYIPFQTPSGENISVLVYNGKPLDPGGGEEPTPTVAPIYLNVKDYGAKGDGTTDDTQAFINAGQGNGYIFVPYGTYLISTASLTSGIRGLLGEMSTIKSTATAGNMLTFAGQWVNISNIILDAPDAENAVSGLNGMILDKVVINGDAEGQIIAMGCRVNNASTIKLSGVSRLASSTLNANISLVGGLTAEITGCQISGSFVLDGVTESNKVFGLAVSGNVFQPVVSLSDSLFTNLRISGNVGLADYPVIKIPDIPEIPDPFNYVIPQKQPLLFNGAGTNKFQLQVLENELEVDAFVSGGWQKVLSVYNTGEVNINQMMAKNGEIAGDVFTVLQNLVLSKAANMLFNNMFRVNLSNENALVLAQYVSDKWKTVMDVDANGVVTFANNIAAPNISGGTQSEWNLTRVSLPLEAASGKKQILDLTRVPGVKDIYDGYTEEQRKNVLVIAVLVEVPGDYVNMATWQTIGQEDTFSGWGSAVSVSNTSDLSNVKNVQVQTLNIPQVLQFVRSAAYTDVSNIRVDLWMLDLNGNAGNVVVIEPEPEPEYEFVSNTFINVNASSTKNYPYPDGLTTGDELKVYLTDIVSYGSETVTVNSTGADIYRATVDNPYFFTLNKNPLYYIQVVNDNRSFNYSATLHTYKKPN